MTCKLCGGLGKGALRGMICPACGGTGMASAAVSTPAEKTLLDEFAKAALCGLCSNGAAMAALSQDGKTMLSFPPMVYKISAAMMQERARRNDDGTLKEEVAEQ